MWQKSQCVKVLLPNMIRKLVDEDSYIALPNLSLMYTKRVECLMMEVMTTGQGMNFSEIIKSLNGLRHIKERILIASENQLEFLVNRKMLFDAYLGDEEFIYSRKCALMMGQFVPIIEVNEDLCDKNPFYKERPVKVAAFPIVPYWYNSTFKLALKIKAVKWGKLFLPQNGNMAKSAFFGTDVELIDILKRKFDISTKFYITGTSSQAIKSVVNKRTDLRIGHPPLTIRIFRMSTPVGAIFDRDFYIVAPVPEKRIALWTFLYPFKRDAWLAFLLAALGRDGHGSGLMLRGASFGNFLQRGSKPFLRREIKIIFWSFGSF